MRYEEFENAAGNWTPADYERNGALPPDGHFGFHDVVGYQYLRRFISSIHPPWKAWASFSFAIRTETLPRATR